MNNEIKEKIKAYYVANDIDKIIDYITNLQEKLEVSQTNEETYRLEMQEITKILGLDEHTLFDEVKEYATNLQQENDRLNKTIDTILEYDTFKDECPLNYSYDTESDEEKSQDIFNEEYCEKCKDDYKKCWLDYFEELKRLKEEKNEQK